MIKSKRHDSYENIAGSIFFDSETNLIDSQNKNQFAKNDNNSNKTSNVVSDLSMFIEPDDPTVQECCLWMKNRFFTKKKLYRLFPPLHWIPLYSLEDLKGDIVSGISVAFTIVPQGLALASLAGLPPQYGLYTSFMGCFVYSLLGSCKDMAVGPTSILAMIVLPYVLIGGSQYSILLAFFAGCLQLIAGILNLGFLVDFISFPVISAFSLAASFSISASQLKGFFGLHYSASRVPQIFSKFFSNISKLNYWDLSLGLLCLLFLIPMQMFKDHRFPSSVVWKNIKIHKIANFIFNLLIICRNALAVLIGSLIAVFYGKILDQDDRIIGNRFTLTQKITPGIPSFEIPRFSVVFENQTIITSFSEIYQDIGTGIFVVSLVGLMEAVAVANAFKINDRKKMDATQEMIALGLSNILGSFVGAFPATGSFSRSAVQHNSGARTPFGGVITGFLVLLALSTLSTYFENIPESVLATIIITSVIFMAHPSDFFLIWKTNKIDVFPYLITFLSSILIGLEFGILIGIAVSLTILLHHMSRPHIFTTTKMTPDNYQFLYVKPDRSIFFSSIEYMKIKIYQGLNQNFTYSNRSHERKIVVVDGEHMFKTDSTFALGMKNMVNHLMKDGVVVIFYRLRRQVFRTIIGISVNPTMFRNCRTEKEVFEMIRSINEIKISHSVSMCHSFKTKQNTIVSTDGNEFGSRFMWLSRSDKFNKPESS